MIIQEQEGKTQPSDSPNVSTFLLSILVMNVTDVSSDCYQQTAGVPGAALLYLRSCLDGRSLKNACPINTMQDALNGPSSLEKDIIPSVSHVIHHLLSLCHRRHLIGGLLFPDRTNTIQQLFGNADNRFLLAHAGG